MQIGDLVKVGWSSDIAIVVAFYDYDKPYAKLRWISAKGGYIYTNEFPIEDLEIVSESER